MFRYHRLLSRAVWLLVLLAAVFELLAPFRVRELGFDGVHAKVWINSFSDVLASGVLVPRWLPRSFSGLGSPTFYFYPPLAFYAAAPFRLLFPALDAVSVYNLVGLVFTLLSFVTAYLLLRSLGASGSYRVLGALVYSFAPFRFFVLYTRSGLSEHFVFVILPLLVLGLYRLLTVPFREQRLSRTVPLLVLSWAGLLLTHIPSAVLCSFVGLAFGLIALWQRRYRNILVTVLSILLGTMLASYYLLPINDYGNFVQLDKLVLFSKVDDALTAIPLLLHGFDFTDNGQGLLGYFSLAATTVILFLAIRRAAADSSILRAAFAAGVTAWIFEATLISEPVWLLLHLNQVVQFTWRWNVIGVAVLALAAAFVRERNVRTALNAVLVVTFLGAVFFAALNVFNLRVHARAADRTPYDPQEYVPAWGIHNDSAAIQFASAHATDPFVTVGTGAGSVVTRDARHVAFQTSLPAAEIAVFHQWYWTSWVLRDAATGAVIGQTPGAYGRATALLPAGEHQFEFTLEERPSERYGKALSLVGLAALLLTTLVLVRYERRSALAEAPSSGADVTVNASGASRSALSDPS